MASSHFATEVPSSLKQLARLVVRGFYSVEDSLIIDMLVRNPCMKEDDIAELLRFDRKYLRARVSTLRNDKFVQMRLKMETGPDGKAQKVNYYFINYRSFVNVVKYKLDLMRKRMETEERDATSRASFKCTNCSKTFTDLEADQLFDFNTQEFHCTYCSSIVEEDVSALPKKDSRLMLARFNEQLQPLYDLLREVEGITLSPEILEPEPVDINTIRGIPRHTSNRPDGQMWSGEATRNQGFAVEEAQIDVIIGDDDMQEEQERKERPIWMTESTVIEDSFANNDVTDSALRDACQSSSLTGTTTNNRRKEVEDIMSVLLQFEKQSDTNGQGLKSNGINGDSSDTEQEDNHKDNNQKPAQVDEIIDDDVKVNEEFPTVFVGGRMVPIHEIDYDLMRKMSSQERDNYILMYQENYNYLHD